MVQFSVSVILSWLIWTQWRFRVLVRGWVSHTKTLNCVLQNGATVFTLLLRRGVAFLHCTATCRPLFKPSVSLLSTYRQSSCVSNFYRTFKVFVWLSFVLCHVSFFQPFPEVEWCLVCDMSDFIEFFFSSCIISFLAQLFQLVFSVHSSTKFWNFHGTADQLSEVSSFQHHTRLCSKCSTSLVSTLN